MEVIDLLVWSYFLFDYDEFKLDSAYGLTTMDVLGDYFF